MKYTHATIHELLKIAKQLGPVDAGIVVAAAEELQALRIKITQATPPGSPDMPPEKREPDR